MNSNATIKRISEVLFQDWDPMGSMTKSLFAMSMMLTPSRSYGCWRAACRRRAGAAWPVNDGEPTGPWWELTFAPTDAKG